MMLARDIEEVAKKNYYVQSSSIQVRRIEFQYNLISRGNHRLWEKVHHEKYHLIIKIANMELVSLADISATYSDK